MLSYDADRRLFQRVLRIVQHWRWILAGTTLCGVAALVVSLFLPKIYRATTYILVSESKIGPSWREEAWQQLATINTYIPLVNNDALIAKEIEKFHLDGPPYHLTVGRFRKACLDVTAPKATRLLEVNVEFPDAALAAAIANDLAVSSEEMNERMNARDTEATQEFLRRRLDQATEHLREVERRRLQLLQSGHQEDLEKQLKILLSEKEQLSAQLLQLSLSLAQDQSKARSFREALRQEPQTYRLTKSVVDDRFLERLTEARDPKSGPPLSITEESLNTTGEEIRRELVKSAGSAEGEKAGIQVAAARLKDVNTAVRQLSQRVTQLRSEIESVENECKLAREAVDTATRDYRNASVTVGAKSDELIPVAPALVPERPVRPHPLLNAILGAILGFVLLVGLAALLESIEDLRAKSLGFAMEDVHVGVERS